MAYDPVKAHEYYIKYRKKGLLKGRKRKSAATASSSKKSGKRKGAKKKSEKKTNLVGLSTSGLNEAGAMKWALAKERLTNEMNTAMSQAKTPEEKAKIRQEYQNKALAELQAIKSDPSMAKQKATKTATAKSGKAGSESNKSDSDSDSDSDSSSKSKKSKKSKKKQEKQGNYSSGGSKIGIQTAGSGGKSVSNSKSELSSAGQKKWDAEQLKITQEMNRAMANAKTPEERSRIKEEYDKRANEVLQEIKSDPNNVVAQKATTKKEKIKNVRTNLDALKSQVANMSTEKKEELKTELQVVVKRLRAKLKG